MTERQIANRIKKIKELEKQAAELETQIEALKTEIKNEMNDSEILTACEFTVHYTNVTSNKLDTKSIKIELPDIYNKYTIQTHSRRFSISISK